jgi:hypothetical protein
MLRTADYQGLHVEVETQACQIPEDEHARLQPGLERLAEAVAGLPSTELLLKVVYHPKSAMYHAPSRLRLPGGSAAAGHRSAWLDEALMRTISRLVHRAERLRAELPAGDVERAKCRAHPAGGVPVPVEPDAGAVGRAPAGALRGVSGPHGRGRGDPRRRDCRRRGREIYVPRRIVPVAASL